MHIRQLADVNGWVLPTLLPIASGKKPKNGRSLVKIGRGNKSWRSQCELYRTRVRKPMVGRENHRRKSIRIPTHRTQFGLLQQCCTRKTYVPAKPTRNPLAMYTSPLLFGLALAPLATSMPIEQRACTGPNINAATIALIKEFEGFVAAPAPDPIGLPTVGYGHLCQTSGCGEVPYPFPLTKSTATQLLLSDVKVSSCASVHRLSTNR